MTRLPRLLLASALLVATAQAITATPAGAFQCNVFEGDAANLAAVDVVFTGTPRAIHDSRGDGGPVVVEFNVDGVYKGEVTNPFVIVTPVGEGASSFTIDEPTLVFAHGGAVVPDLEDGFFEVNCGGATRPLSEAAPEFDHEPTAPIVIDQVDMAAIQRQLGSPRPWIVPELIIGVSVLAFVLGLAAWLNRKDRTVS